MKRFFFVFAVLFLFAFNTSVYATSASTTEENNAETGSNNFNGLNVTSYSKDAYTNYSPSGNAPDGESYDNVKNEAGHVTGGTVYSVLKHRVSGKNYDVAIYRTLKLECSGGMYILYDSSASSYSSMFQLFPISGYVTGTDSTSVYSYLAEAYTGGSSGPYQNGQIISGYNKLQYDLAVFATNIPIFAKEDTEAIDKYKKNGDTTGALNGDTYDGDKTNGEYSDEVEKPRGLQCTGTFQADWSNGLFVFLQLNSDIELSWYYPTDWEEYKFDIQFRANYQTKTGFKDGKWYSPDNYIGTYGEGTTLDGSPVDYNVIRKYFPMNTDMQNKYFGAPVKDDPDIVKVKSLEFRIRNRIGNKYSDWVVVSMDGKSSSAHVEDDNGNVKDDDEYDGGSVTPGDSDNGNSDTDISSNVSSILAFIRDGFGLLGNGGVISLMSRCFVYLPSSVWTMIKFLVAMMVLMAVISLIKKFVFG